MIVWYKIHVDGRKYFESSTIRYTASKLNTMVVQKLCLKEELTNFTASSTVHPSFEGLPTFTDALSTDEGQAFLFLGMVKVGVIVFKEILVCAKKKLRRFE
jgi:hypothetical protein